MELNEDRKSRYHSKIGYILEKMYSLPDNTAVLDELEIDGVLYRVQTSIEAAMDLAAMLVRDIGIEVGDDYDNIETLKEKKVIGAELAEELKRLNGMRNAIVHKYGGVNTELILQNLEIIKETLQIFVEIIEGELI
ncbi:hypothetical protein ANME2D_01863 [Candidatus Methanoperedens nitroreducens]|uniref:DUF86 domain-containing protein n=1 Tax=Candidatus Methanoperedens nitratireducens TaxID=1392998 RepID=A0A062V5D3_9EURY|nr:DUF86 domain-containing protein [Candidatus Methanoperedens nitroreducens]KCZ71808.1 hypothetical protein ANME2D_01863 [Candidatus Methanoperedens nitroreducens]MDJ1422217.1 DUF86 domain-containing protein [Candidatus Methanoperedens sp.]